MLDIFNNIQQYLIRNLIFKRDVPIIHTHVLYIANYEQSSVPIIELSYGGLNDFSFYVQKFVDNIRGIFLPYVAVTFAKDNILYKDFLDRVYELCSENNINVRRCCGQRFILVPILQFTEFLNIVKDISKNIDIIVADCQRYLADSDYTFCIVDLGDRIFTIRGTPLWIINSVIEDNEY